MKTKDTKQTLSANLSQNKHLLTIALIVFLLVYLASFVKGYGYFIDEFYYIACAANPDFGYVDHPPLAPFVLSVFQFLFGTSVYAIRILPALGQAGAVFLTGILAKEIGGGKFAQVLAACAMAASPTVMAFGGFYSMNAFEPLLATAALYHTALMIKENNAKRWVLLGVLMGLGMMNKHTFGVFAVALVLSLLVTGKWRLVANKWFLAGALCGFVIFLPNIFWQVAHNYPSLEFYRNITRGKNVYTPPLAFVGGQVLGMSPFNVPIWLGGVVFLIFARATKQFRFLAALFAGLFLFMMLSGTSRSDRLMFAYPAAFAGGGLLFEFLAVKYNASWLKGVLVGVLAVSALAFLPLVLPLLSYEKAQAYTEFLGINTEIERGKKPPLSQLLADRIGWEEKVELVARAYQNLTEEDKKQTIIAVGNYGQAGAIELFGKKHGLPPVVCAHNNYYLWSKDRLRGSVVLMLAYTGSYEGLKEQFESVEPCDGVYTNPYVSHHENNLKVYVCRGPKRPPSELLERGRVYS